MTIATQTMLLTGAETEVETHTLVTEVTVEVVKVLTTIETTTTISREIPVSKEVGSRANTNRKVEEIRTMVVAQEVQAQASLCQTFLPTTVRKICQIFSKKLISNHKKLNFFTTEKESQSVLALLNSALLRRLTKLLSSATT